MGALSGDYSWWLNDRATAAGKEGGVHEALTNCRSASNGEAGRRFVSTDWLCGKLNILIPSSANHSPSNGEKIQQKQTPKDGKDDSRIPITQSFQRPSDHKFEQIKASPRHQSE